MHLEVLDRRARAGRIQLPGTITASDARKIHVFDRWRQRLPRGRGWTRKLGVDVDGGVAHHAFEAVVGVGAAEGGEGGGEPGGGWGLDFYVSWVFDGK